MKTWLVVTALALLVNTAGASLPPMPRLHVVTSEGRFFFVMHPADYVEKDGDLEISTPARGKAYKVNEDGSFKELWSLGGWYAPPENLLMSPDGRTLIHFRGHQELMRRDGSFAEGELQYVLGVYRDGEKVAAYLAKELIENIEMGTRFHPFGGYGFGWLDRNSRDSPWLGPGHLYSEDIIRNGKKVGSCSPIVLHLQTYEGTRYEFDLETGKILGRKEKEPEVKVPVGENPFEPNAE